MTYHPWISIAAMLFALAAEPSPERAAPALPPGPPSASPAAAANPTDYVVSPGDVLRVFVWKEPELSGEVQVRLDGKITVLLIGDVMAWGRNPMQIGTELEQKLSRYVEAPSVTVVVSQPNSVRYFLLGQVAKPGMYPLTTRMTVVQALAMGGGFATFAKKDKILILHERTRTLNVDHVDYDRIQSGDTWQNYELQPGDTILVP